MPQYPTISYEKNGETYEAVLTFSDMGKLSNILRDGGFYDMPPNEDFVTKLIADGRRAGIFEKAELYKNGEPNDAPNGEPAVQIYKEGRFVYAASAQDGKVTCDLTENDLRPRAKAEYVAAAKPLFSDQPDRIFFTGKL